MTNAMRAKTQYTFAHLGEMKNKPHATPFYEA